MNMNEIRTKLLYYSHKLPISIFIKSNLKNSRVDVTGVRNSFSFTDFTVLHFCCFLFSRLVIIVSFFATRGRVFRLKTVQKSKLSSTILRLTWGFDFELFGDEEKVCYRVQLTGTGRGLSWDEIENLTFCFFDWLPSLQLQTFVCSPSRPPLTRRQT